MSRSGLCFVSVGFVYGCFGAGVTTLFMRVLLLLRVIFDGYDHPRAFRTSHHRGQRNSGKLALLAQDRLAIALEAVTPTLTEALILGGSFGNKPHHTTSRRSDQPSERPAIHHLFFTRTCFVVVRKGK